MTNLSTFLISICVIFMASPALSQKLQVTGEVLSFDFNRENRWDPLHEDLSFPSGTGLQVTIPTSNYFSLGGEMRYGRVRRADSELIDQLDDQLLWTISGMAKVNFLAPKYWMKPFMSVAIGAQNINNDDGIRPIVNLGLGTDLRLYKNLHLSISTSFSREVSRNRYFLDYGLGLSWLIHDTNTKDASRIENEYVNVGNDFDSDGLADVVDECPELAGSVATGGCPDIDGDGIADHKDECPELAGLASNNGCPLTVEQQDEGLKDSDGDGVSDDVDRCPDQFGNLRNLGCPEPDTDNDGVLDTLDLCPDTPGSIDNRGCPEDFDISSLLNTAPVTNEEQVPVQIEDAPMEPMEEGEKVTYENDHYTQENKFDLLDEDEKNDGEPVVIADEPADEASLKLETGDNISERRPQKTSEMEPDVQPTPQPSQSTDTGLRKDSDGDGIADDIDHCPLVFGKLEDRGCPPDNSQVARDQQELDKETDLVFDFQSEVKFPLGVASIQRKYTPILDEVAAYLLANSKATLEIHGHADPRGSFTYNDILSESRARACYTYLKIKGVDPKRMTYKGLGEAIPEGLEGDSLSDSARRTVVFRFFENL